MFICLQNLIKAVLYYNFIKWNSEQAIYANF